MGVGGGLGGLQGRGFSGFSEACNQVIAGHKSSDTSRYPPPILLSGVFASFWSDFSIYEQRLNPIHCCQIAKCFHSSFLQ